MKKLFLAFLLVFPGLAFARNGTVYVIDKIAPKNAAFVGVVDSSQTVTNVTNFNGNLSSADTDVQKALDTLDNMSVSGGGGASTLAVKQNGVSVSSPTSVINLLSPMIASLQAGTTAQVTIDTSSASGVLIISSATANFMTQSSSTLNDLKLSSASATYLNKLSIYVASVTGNAAITITGTNNAAGAAPIFSANSSSVTLYGPNIPAASISAGSLGTSVLASSLTATGVTSGSYTNTNLTVDAQGRISSASNGTSGGGDVSSSNGTIFVMTVSSSITNSSAETNVIGIGSGTITLPANYFQRGKTLRIKSSGIYSSTTTSGVFTFKFKLGSTIILSTASVSLVDNQTNQFWSFGVALTCRTSGTQGSVVGNTSFGMFDATNGYRNFPMTMTSSVTIDTTASQQIVVTGQFGTANSNNSFTHTNFVVAGETITTVGGVSIGGSNTNVQFNNNGAFGGDSGFQYDSSASSVSITGKLGVAGPVTFSSTTVGFFDLTFDACQAKLPGSNSPYISNSTNETSCSIYFDDTSTQSVTYTGLTTHYDGRPLYADIIFTSTATSGTMNWGVYTDTRTPNLGLYDYDSSRFSVIVTTSVDLSSGVSNSLKKATVALSNTTASNGDMITFKLERQAGLSDTAVGFGRVKKLRIYE